MIRRFFLWGEMDGTVFIRWLAGLWDQAAKHPNFMFFWCDVFCVGLNCEVRGS